jgi:dihydrodipicolinate synthase/N-acetylneuraminate lyase
VVPEERKERYEVSDTGVGPEGGEPVGLFRGVGVALVTLFDADGGLDAGATAEHAARLVDLGIRAVLVAGTTGEPASLEADERRALLAAVRRAVPAGGGVPVIAGTGAASTRQAVAHTVAACDGGADAVLALSPPQVADPRPYYDAVAKAAGAVPVLAYHFPESCPPGISIEHLRDLPVAGCKDSSGDVTRFHEELARFDGALYVGSPVLTYLAGVMGATGALLAIANVDPERCVAAFGGDVDAQKALIAPHLTATAAFPSALKGLVAARFGTSTTVRMGRDGC